MPNDDADVDVLLARLEDTPGRIAAAVEGQPSAQLAERTAVEAWSALAVLAHIRSSDDFVSSRLVMMLVRDEPQLLAFDERRWCDVMAYADADFHELLTGFACKRAELIRALRRLAPRDWQRTGLHESRGQITLLETLRHLVEHEAEHCLQIETLLERV